MVLVSGKEGTPSLRTRIESEKVVFIRSSD